MTSPLTLRFNYRSPCDLHCFCGLCGNSFLDFSRVPAVARSNLCCYCIKFSSLYLFLLINRVNDEKDARGYLQALAAKMTDELEALRMPENPAAVSKTLCRNCLSDALTAVNSSYFYSVSADAFLSSVFCLTYNE